MPVKKTVAKVARTTYDELSDDVKAVMDRAVRIARKSYWCDRFDENAPAVFNVPANDVVDSDGFSCRGYNRQGFNAEGWNREGYNAEGYDERGFNKAGFDKEGYDRNGNNAEGLDRQGRDKYRYDVNGYDQDGYDNFGQRRRASRDWYTIQAAKPETEFHYDGRGTTRPKAKTTAAKKATPAKVVAAKTTVARARTPRKASF